MRQLNVRRLLLACCACCMVFAGTSCDHRRDSAVAELRYTVAQGDTLLRIARRSGLRIQDIIHANQLRTRKLRIGQTLILPGVSSMQPEKIITTQVMAYETVTRKQWSALPMKSNYDPMGGITHMTVHHTSEIPGMMDRNDKELVQAIARYHRNTRGWADIGYHYLIGRDGKVYEGRIVGAQGAHAKGANNKHNLGIAVIGDFNNTLPNEKQLRTLELFLADQQRKYRIASTRVYGHIHFTVTDCPGTQLRKWLNGYRKRH